MQTNIRTLLKQTVETHESERSVAVSLRLLCGQVVATDARGEPTDTKTRISEDNTMTTELNQLLTHPHGEKAQIWIIVAANR